MTEKKKKHEFPSLVEQGKNLANTVKDIAKDAVKWKGIVAPHETVLKRIKICRSCEYYYESSNNDNLSRCSACGCMIIAKVNMASSECPKGKWGKCK